MSISNSDIVKRPLIPCPRCLGGRMTTTEVDYHTRQPVLICVNCGYEAVKPDENHNIKEPIRRKRSRLPARRR